MTFSARNETPLVFVHNGPSQVVVTACVAQARAAGCKRIFVISDRIGPWAILPGVHAFAFSYAEKFGVKEFRAVFANYSSYPADYASVIFEKFFALRALFAMHSLDRVLYIDSDVLLFRPVQKLATEYLCDFTGTSCHEENDETVSPHFMFLTPQVCDRVCDELMKAYGSKEGHERLKELWKLKLQVDPSWGVCEMDFLALVRDSGDFKFIRVNEGNPRVDMSIHYPEGFVCKDGYKKLTFEKGLPYGELEATGEKVLFSALHMQGYHKHLAIHYAQVNWFYKKVLYRLWALESRGFLKWPKERRAQQKNPGS